MIIISVQHACLLLTFCTFWPASSVQGVPAKFFEGRSRRAAIDNDLGGLSHQLYFHEIKPASHMETFLHESISLTCQAGGSPPPTLHWLKNGKPIFQDSFENSQVVGSADNQESSNENSQPSSGYPPTSIGLSSTRSRLFLDCLTAQDTAIYTCVAETPFSRISTDTKLIVSDVASKLVGGNECFDKRGSSSGYGKPARITMWTDTRMELTGVDVRLFCRASGSPTPQVIWERADAGQVIHNDAKHKILPNGDLIIKKISWEEDMGRFVCVAQNNLGIDKAKMFLYPTPGL